MVSLDEKPPAEIAHTRVQIMSLISIALKVPFKLDLTWVWWVTLRFRLLSVLVEQIV